LPTPKRNPTPIQLSANNVRFLFDGERLHETQTPKDLNMENGDEIDVVIEQVGGAQERQ
jgi:small ubiquitin-related modifier